MNNCNIRKFGTELSVRNRTEPNTFRIRTESDVFSKTEPKPNGDKKNHFRTSLAKTTPCRLWPGRGEVRRAATADEAVTLRTDLVIANGMDTTKLPNRMWW